MSLRLAFAAALLSLASAAAHAVPGDDDTAFGVKGYDDLPLLTEAGCPPSRTCWRTALALFVRPDGRFVVAAEVDYNTTELLNYVSQTSLVLYQRLKDGGPDPAFGNNGMSIVANGQVRAMAMQPDGKILASVAYQPQTFIAPTTRMLRITASGALDPTFGNGGAVTMPVVDAIAVQSDGKIVVATYESGAGPDLVVRRLLPDGQPDRAFGTGGQVAVGFPNLGGASYYDGRLRVHVAYAFEMRVTPDDRVLIAASLVQSASSPKAAAIVRLTAGGVLDTTFNGTGRLQLEDGTALAIGRPVPEYASAANGALGMQSSGRIVLSGTSGNTPYLFGITPAGALDVSFGLAGRALLTTMPGASIPPGSVATGAIVVQGNDRIVAVGDFAIQRFTSDGWRDVTFRQSPSSFFDRHFVALQGNDVLTAGSGRVRRTVGGDQLDVFSDARNFAMAQYRDFLDREGDAGGIDYWSGAIQSGSSSRGQMVEAFLDTPEFQSKIAPVVRLYLAYFKRIPDLGGLRFWTDFLRRTGSVDAMSNLFSQSGEFTSTYGALDNGQFVDLVYRNVLNRAPDAAGFAYWKGQLDSGSMTRGGVMASFSESSENRQLSYSRVFVTMAYAAMLRRMPEQGGYDYWVGSMNSGTPGRALVDGILGSAEYRARFLP